MFGDNQKISSRQVNRLMVVQLFSGTCLILPMAVVRICGISGVAAIAAGVVLTGFFVWFLIRTIQYTKESYPQYCKSVLGIPWGNVVLSLYSLKYFAQAAFLLAAFAQIVNHTFLTDIPQWILGAALLGVCIYAVSKGMETYGRLGELLMWVIIVPFIGVILFAIPKVRFQWIFSKTFFDADMLVWAMILSLACFSTVEWLLFLRPCVEKQKHFFTDVVRAILWAAVLNIIILIVCVGVFSVEGMNGERWPMVTLMQMVRMPGKILTRQDGLILAFWMMGMFILISGSFLHGCQCLKAVRPSFDRSWKMIYPAVGIWIIFSWISMEDATRWYLNFMIFVYLPLSVGIPLLLYVVRRVRKKHITSLLCLVVMTSSLFLNGCISSVGMEDRNFVMCLGIDYDEQGLNVSMGFPDLKALTGNGDNIHLDAIALRGESLEEIFQSYHAQNSKRLDFGQLQMIVFGREMLKNQKQMENVLTYIKEHQEFTRMISVCAAKEKARDIVALDDDVNGSIGIYLREMFENNYPTDAAAIGDLIISLSNDEPLWELAVLDVGQGVPVIVDKEYITYYLKEE